MLFQIILSLVLLSISFIKLLLEIIYFWQYLQSDKKNTQMRNKMMFAKTIISQSTCLNIVTGIIT